MGSGSRNFEDSWNAALRGAICHGGSMSRTSAGD